MTKLAKGILPALCTPFDSNGELDTDLVVPLVQRLLAAGANGFFVCGGTGEGKSMTVPERRQMASAVIHEVAGAVPNILHVGGAPTRDCVELAKHAAEAGADAVASVAPIDQAADIETTVAHYSAIGGATDRPFYVYWHSQFSDQAVSAEEFLDAMDAVPNFCGIKFTDYNFFKFQQMIMLTEGRLNAITGPDEMCLPGLVMGSDGAIGSTYNFMPRLFLAMVEDVKTGNITSAMNRQRQANEVITLLTRYGVLGAVKAILGWQGVPVGPPRPPHKELSPENEEALKTELDALGFELE